MRTPGSTARRVSASVSATTWPSTALQSLQVGVGLDRHSPESEESVGGTGEHDEVSCAVASDARQEESAHVFETPLTILSEDALDAIHSQAMTILEDVGPR